MKVEPLGALLDQLGLSCLKFMCAFISCFHNPDRQAPRGPAHDLNNGQTRTASIKNIDAVTDASFLAHESIKFIAKCSSVRFQFLHLRRINCFLSDFALIQGKANVN